MNKTRNWSKAMAGKIVTFLLISTIIVTIASCGKPKPFTDLNEITTYLSKARGNIEKPVRLIVNIPLGDVTNSGSGYQRLLMIIENAGKSVALDLSECQMTNTEFNPVYNVNSGKFYIVSLVIPEAAKSVVGYRDVASFQHFSNLRSVAGKEVTSVGRNAFKDCVSLRTANFPLVAAIADGVFNGCTDLETVNFPLATTVGTDSFNNCSSLKSMDIPLATSIGESAFANCSSMTSISFPASASITNNPFLGCSSLASFNLTGAGDLNTLEDGKALAKNGTELIGYPSASGTIVMPTVTVIGRSAFNSNTAITAVSFPAVTNVGIRAFRGCINLSSVDLPAVTAIGTGAFESTGTIALTVTLGEKVPTIGGGLFSGVTETKPVTLKVPDGITGYGQNPVNTTANNFANRFRGAGYESRQNWWGEWETVRTGNANDKIEITLEFMEQVISAEVAQ